MSIVQHIGKAESVLDSPLSSILSPISRPAEYDGYQHNHMLIKMN
jgi:hypothetical protein